MCCNNLFSPFSFRHYPVCPKDTPETVYLHLKRIHSVVACFRDEYRMGLLAFVGRSSEAADLLTISPAIVLMLVNAHRFWDHTDTDLWAEAAEMLPQKRRHILTWLGWPNEEWCVRMVSRVSPVNLTVDDLLMLRKMCLGKLSSKNPIHHLSRINAEVIRVAKSPRLLRRVSFSFLEILAGEEDGWPASLFLIRSIKWARRQNVELPVFKSGIHLRCMYERLLKVEQPSEWDSTYSGVKLPEPILDLNRKPIPSDIEIDWFRTARELFDWGCEEHNCVFEMTQDVLDQRIILIKVHKPVRGTLKLEQDSGGDWIIANFLAARNKPVSKDALFKVASHLDQCLYPPGEYLDDIPF